MTMVSLRSDIDGNGTMASEAKCSPTPGTAQAILGYVQNLDAQIPREELDAQPKTHLGLYTVHCTLLPLVGLWIQLLVEQ